MANQPDGNVTIGFVGLGQMGLPMSKNLVNAGFSLAAYDLRDEAMQEIKKEGAIKCTSPAAVAEESFGVHVAVVDDDQVNDVVRGEEGVFAGFRRGDDGGVIVIHSTVLPETVASLAKDAPEGVEILDVAMSGGQPRAEAGDLTLMVGGEKTVFERYQPVLDPISRTVHYLGQVGSGLAAKLANNLIFHACEAATMEALELGNEYGVSQEELLDVFSESTGDNYFLRNFDYFTGEYLTTHPAGLRGPARNARKNLYQALLLAKSQEIELPVTGLVSQRVPELWNELADEIEVSEGS